MKTCSKCGETLSLTCFTKDSSTRDGRYPSCKECRKKYSSKYREENKDRVLLINRMSRHRNLDSIRRKDLIRNKDPKRKASKNARQRYYLVKHRSLNNMFHTATESIYLDCVWLNKYSEEIYEVDHIVPLKGNNVSGLHVPWTLEIVSRFQNRSKSNKLI